MMKPWLLSCGATVFLIGCESMLGPLPEGEDPFGNPFKQSPRGGSSAVDSAESSAALDKLKAIVASPSPLVLFASGEGEANYDRTVIAAGGGDPDAISKVMQFSTKVSGFVESDQAEVLQALHSALGQMHFDRALAQEPGHVQVQVNTLMSLGTSGRSSLPDDSDIPLEMPPTDLPDEPIDPLNQTPSYDTQELDSLESLDTPTQSDPPVMEDPLSSTFESLPPDLTPLEETPAETTPQDNDSLLDLESLEPVEETPEEEDESDLPDLE